MKSVGYALILAVLVVGGGWVCNLLSEMATSECFKKCPGHPEALTTKFDVGPFHLQMCNCGLVKQ